MRTYANAGISWLTVSGIGFVQNVEGQKLKAGGKHG